MIKWVTSKLTNQTNYQRSSHDKILFCKSYNNLIHIDIDRLQFE